MKKSIIKFSLTLLFLIILAILFFSNKITNSKDASQNPEAPFKIKKQMFYSGILPKSTSYNDSENWNLSISQYTDIAIYISTTSTSLDDSNTISALYIDNIKYEKMPKVGTPSLYYQNPKKFATDAVSSEYLIETHLNYNILNFDNEENYDYYSTPNFFVDCSLPITLKYVNSDILKNYKVANSEPLIFNGQILKKSNINLFDLESTISFCINIVSNENKLYKYNMNIDIPLRYSDYNLFDKNILISNDLNEFFISK